MRYCPHCGAANEEKDRRCFACTRSLTGPLEEEQEILLHGRYQIQTQIGSGGYGAVYRALDTQEHGRVVAIKSINLKGLNPTEIIEATDGFNREHTLLSQLAHHHLPQVYDYFTDPEHWHLVMQYIEGATLEYYLRNPEDDHLHATRTLPLDEVIDMALQLCDVLNYLHTHNPPIIYRDLKPSNIMRTPQGRLYLIDFGIARHYKAGQTKDTIPLGSPGYAAPEQHGKAQTTQRADIYSLGALLHLMLSGDDPSETPFSFAPLRAYGEEGFSELADLIPQMVNLDASHRPPNVQVIKQHIQDIIRQRQKTPPAPIKPAQTGRGTMTTFTLAQPGSQAYSSDYYVPGQTQQQVGRQKKKPLTTRRQLLIGLAAIGIFYGGNIAFSAIGGEMIKREMPPQNDFPPIDPTNPPATTSLNRTRIATRNKQELIIPLDTAQLMGYDTIHFASADETGLISFWDETNTQRFQIGIGQAVRSLNWGPKNGYLLAATAHDVYRIIVRELQEGSNSLLSDWHMKLNLPNEPITSVAFSNNENDILVADRTGTVTVYQSDARAFQQWTQIRRFPGRNTSQQASIGNDSNMALNSQESRLATLSSTDEVTVWDFQAGQKLQTLPISLQDDGTVTVLSWHPHGFDVGIGTEKGVAHFWRYNGGDAILKIAEDSVTRINGITWKAQGSNNLYDQSSMVIATNQGVMVWDTQKLIVQAKMLKDAEENIKAVAVAKLNPSDDGAIPPGPSIEYALVTGEKFVEFWR
jgi:hypothetical protein